MRESLFSDDRGCLTGLGRPLLLSAQMEQSNLPKDGGWVAEYGVGWLNPELLFRLNLLLARKLIHPLSQLVSEPAEGAFSLYY